MKNTLKKRAFTLIEVVIALGLSLIILSLLTGVLKSSQRTLSILKSQNKVLRDSHFLKNYLEDEISSSNYILERNNKCGFLLFFNTNNKYRYVYYSFNPGEKEVYRYSLNTKRKLDKNSEIRGSKNLLASNVSDCKFNFDGKKINIKVKFKDERIANDFEIIVSNRTFGDY